ncbi:hypothetical protein T01_14065 [Trichinella spiralis]|uniref:Uncharacterized protein n=1 Tax=Trichinella spiralis TaxID=6334 RepID=A0A0V1BK37_TRISP|nr:hypothetical protein T01_14065 [Trichinella spiralis]
MLKEDDNPVASDFLNLIEGTAPLQSYVAPFSTSSYKIALLSSSVTLLPAFAKQAIFVSLTLYSPSKALPNDTAHFNF